MEDCPCDLCQNEMPVDIEPFIGPLTEMESIQLGLAREMIARTFNRRIDLDRGGKIVLGGKYRLPVQRLSSMTIEL